MPVPSKSKLGTCDYCQVHERKRVRVPVQLCDLCGEYFCDEHIQSKVPQYSVQIEGKKSKLDDTRKPGHPCPPYMEIVDAREKERHVRTQESLAKMDGEKAIPGSVKSWEGAAAYSEQTTEEQSKGETESIHKAVQKVLVPPSQKTSEKHSEALPTHSTKKKAALAVIAFVIFLVIVILIFHIFS